MIRLSLRQITGLGRYFIYLKEFYKFSRSAKSRDNLPVLWRDRYPILNEATPKTLHREHYLYFPAWAARKLQEIGPAKHVDISSYFQFSTIISAFIPTEFYDYRPASIMLSSLHLGRCDLTQLHFPSDSILSLSCMHVVEHIGLGRYGDALDLFGDVKAISELIRVLAPGGTLLFVVPMGKPKVRFNAHRIYSYRQIAELFGALDLLEFSLIPDDEEVRGMIPNASEAVCDQQVLGCGCFVFRKPLPT